MVIKLACECGSSFTLTDKISENQNGYMNCPCCNRSLPSGTCKNAQTLFRNYAMFCKELEGSGISVKSIKLSEKTSEK
jgi:hypothetical protein